MLPAKSDVMQINLMDCKRGNLAEVQNAVSRGADINFQDQYGNTPLISATERDKIEIICYLLSCPEIEIDKTDLYGSTPLSFAVKNSSNAAVRKMVSGGANVNAIDKDGLASLHYAILGWNDGEDAAIKNNKLDVLNFLLECRDIIVDLRTPDDDTSLILAENNCRLGDWLACVLGFRRNTRQRRCKQRCGQPDWHWRVYGHCDTSRRIWRQYRACAAECSVSAETGCGHINNRRSDNRTDSSRCVVRHRHQRQRRQTDQFAGGLYWSGAADSGRHNCLRIDFCGGCRQNQRSRGRCNQRTRLDSRSPLYVRLHEERFLDCHGPNEAGRSTGRTGSRRTLRLIMATGFEDATTTLTETLLAFAGESCVYIRGASSTTITLRRSTLAPQYMDTGTGQITEVRPVDFIGLAVSLPYAVPLAGDRITCGGSRYEVTPTTGEKCFRQITSTMIRIHTKQV